MKLYGTVISPFVRHCRIALQQEGYKFEFIDADKDAVAVLSPTQKMPYFTDTNLSLSDSSSIVKYTRERAGKPFLPALQDFERFTMTNTVLDTLINFRILSAEGYTPDTIQYMGKQLRRAQCSLESLNQSIDPTADLYEDSAVRTACLIDWGLFRECIDLDGLDNLATLLEHFREHSAFTATAPPR